MRITFDLSKNEKNIRERGLSFELAEYFNWDTALILRDNRKDYGEIRYFSLGMISEELFALVYTDRNNERRIISLRKATKREERKFYEQA